MSTKQLVKAMREKYGSTRAVMQKLGLDHRLLNDADPSRAEELRSSERGGHFDPRGGRNAGGGEVLGGVHREGEDDIPSPEERRVSPLQNEDEGPPIERPSPLQNMADDDEMYDPLREHLRNHGMSEDEVEQAIEVARRHVAQDRRRRSSNGHDKHADDRFPKRGRGDPLIDRGTEATDNFGTVNPANPDEPFLARHGLDRRGGGALDHAIAAIDEEHRLASRIVIEPEIRPLDKMPYDRRSRRHAMDSKPGMTEQQKAELFKLIPGLDLVGDASSDGPGVRDRKNRFEV
jgi:hypothetical protein